MKLNPAKCVFAIASRNFLGFMVSQRGIRANPDKVEVIIKVKSPKTVKEVQSLTGKVAALNRFISSATDKCMPFFQVKGVLDEATSIKPLEDGREAVSLSSSIQYCSKFGTDQRRRKCSKANLLYQSSIPRSDSMLPKDGEDSFRIIGHLYKVLSSFPSTPHHHHDRLAHKKDDEQDKCCKMTRLMGN